MSNSVEAALAEIRRHWSVIPRVALVLGTGLGQLARRVSAEATIPFATIPGFARTTAVAHRGRLVCGKLAGVPTILLDGRCHFYEGYSFDDVTLPIRVVRACGAETLIITNASGGLNRYYSPGDIMVIEDHIDLMGRVRPRSLAGRSTLRGPRSTPSLYDPKLVEFALAVSRRCQFRAHQGIYAAVTGPNYETRAEYAFLRRIGADVVGMSTVPEVHVASQIGMRILGLSIVTNVAHIDYPAGVDAQHVVNAAEQAEPYARRIIEEVLRSS